MGLVKGPELVVWEMGSAKGVGLVAGSVTERVMVQVSAREGSVSVVKGLATEMVQVSAEWKDLESVWKVLATEGLAMGAEE
jgi:hypothetical protein